LLAVAAGRQVRLLQTDGVLARAITDHPSTVADIAWRPDRDELVVARYGGITVWSPGREQPVQALNYRGSVLRVAVNPTGRFVATADQNSTVHFWRTKTWQDAEMSGYPHLVTSLSWDSTGRYLATDGGEDGMVWDCSAPGPEGRMPTFLKGTPDSLVRCVAFAPDRAVCAVAGESGEVTLHDVAHPARRVIGSVASAVTTLAWASNNYLATGTAAGQLEAYAGN
jgi:WD40 repeat protein